jgi:hypothetical protein
VEENEWVYESSRGCCKVNACISFYAAKWLFRRHLDQTYGLQMQLCKFGYPYIHLEGFGQQDHTSTNVCILNNPHARQKRNEKKAFDRIKKKVESQ